MAQYVDVEKYLDDNFCDEFDECVSNEDCFICWARRHTEDVAPIVHSSWRTLYGYSKCNNCGQRMVTQTNYCPNCGAKMDKV